MRVLLIGAQGHARVCLDALQDNGAVVVGAVSSDATGIVNLGVRLLGYDREVARIAAETEIDAVFVAIGDNSNRRRLFRQCTDQDLEFCGATSRYSMISAGSNINDGVAVFSGAVINTATDIGKAVIVNTNASVDHDCLIGDFAHIAPGATVAGGVTVGEGALIGIGARVLPNLTIGAWATVGAGAVVTRDVPSGVTVVGVPARILER
jgi:UDP-perosamine 4-acetyltransferase